MILATHYDVDQFLSAKFAEGQGMSIYKSIQLISDAPYYLHDRLVPGGRLQSSMFFDFNRLIDLIFDHQTGEDSIYAVFPRRFSGGRRRVFSAITAIWLCSPPTTVANRDPVWRIHTDHMIYLINRPDITRGEEIELSLQWSEDT